MALLDLSLVTECFTSLLQQRIPTFPVWPTAANLMVSGAPPDLVKGPYALSFYLYHVREDAHTKSQDPDSSDANPQRFQPMGLTLYYVMTPRSNTADADKRAQADQIVMGLALKSMHDAAYIDDTTTVPSTSGPQLVMPLKMRAHGNRLRSRLQPTPENEAVQYWQAGTSPLRLAAYYEVAATLLEPDELTTSAGRVLLAGVHTMVGGAPRIDSVSNRIQFTIPGQASAETRELSPASVPYGSELNVRGANLKGDRTALLLSNRDFAEPVETDAAWSMTTDGSLLKVTVQPTVGGIAILPGVYGAIVRTTSRRTLPDGSQRDFDSLSNEAGFAIAPAILSVGGGAVRTVKFDMFEPHLVSDPDLVVFAGTNKLQRVTSTPPAAGEFFTPSSPAAARTTLRLRYPASATSGEILPLRVIARGAESGPSWDMVP